MQDSFLKFCDCCQTSLPHYVGMEICPHGKKVCDECSLIFPPESVCELCSENNRDATPKFGYCAACGAGLIWKGSVGDTCLHGVKLCEKCGEAVNGYAENHCEQCKAGGISFRNAFTLN